MKPFHGFVAAAKTQDPNQYPSCGIDLWGRGMTRYARTNTRKGVNYSRRTPSPKPARNNRLFGSVEKVTNRSLLLIGYNNKDHDYCIREFTVKGGYAVPHVDKWYSKKSCMNYTGYGSHPICGAIPWLMPDVVVTDGYPCLVRPCGRGVSCGPFEFRPCIARIVRCSFVPSPQKRLHMPALAPR